MSRSRSDGNTNRYIISVTILVIKDPYSQILKRARQLYSLMKATTPLKVAVSILNFLSVSSFIFAFLISTNDSNILNVQGQGYVNATIVLDSSTLGNKSYKPNPIEIPVGNSVVWTNDDLVSHSVTAIKGEFDSNILHAGKVFKHNFDEVGVYDYYCMLHPSMVGRILVAK